MSKKRTLILNKDSEPVELVVKTCSEFFNCTKEHFIKTSFLSFGGIILDSGFITSIDWFKNKFKN